MSEENREIIDYTEQDIYDYFGASQDLWKANRVDLLGIIGGMSGILELIWHKEITPEASFRDFKNWLKETQELDIEVEEEQNG